MRTIANAPWLLTAARVLCVAAGMLASSRALPAEQPRLYDGRTLDDWRQAIQQLDFRSPDRAAAVPGLRQIIRDPEAQWFTRRQAALTLGRIGEPAQSAVPDLIELLDAERDPVETTPPLWAMKSLALFGPLAKEAAPKAIQILQDEQEPIFLRLTATETLARIGVSSVQGIRALIDGASAAIDVGGDALELRVACIEALQLPRPPSALPMLIAACEDPSDRVRHAAAATLGYLGSHAEPAAEVLGALAVHDEIPVIRETAARSLAQAGPRGADVLLRLFSSSDHDVLLLAIDGASRTTINREILATGLTPLFQHDSSLIAARAMDASWRLTRQAAPILDQLIGFLESDDRSVRKSASDTLILMGEAVRPAVTRLQRLADHGSIATRTAAQRVLRRLPSVESRR